MSVAKAVISNKIYLSDPEDTNASWATQLKESCTHKIPVPFNPMAGRFAKPYKIMKSYSYIGNGIFTIPSGRTDLIPDYFEIVDKRITIDKGLFPKFGFPEYLRDSQKEAIDFAVKHNNCLISARPGWGKTFTGLAIAAQLKQKTLVVVHTKALMKQWIEEIKKVYNLAESQIGTIWEGKVDIGEFITVGIIRTINTNRMKIAKEFGLVIVDEVHHLPADEFSCFIDSSHAKHKIGMTGTLERKDKKHCLIYDYISMEVFDAPDENVMVPTVDVINVPISFDEYDGSYAAKVTSLNSDPTYVRLVANLCTAYADLGHKVLFVSDRVSILEELARMIGSRAVAYHSSLSESEKLQAFKKLRSGQADILVGSIRIFMEGISENYLSCLVLGASISGPPLTQLVGRVIRQNEGKLEPVIVDLLLKGRSMKKHHDDRVDYYAGCEYSINYIG